jgi:general stress protein 26
MKDELAKLYEMIEDLKIAMMTTRRGDGHMVSRPMATQRHTPGADLWFMTMEHMCKLDELEVEPHVNLAYYKDRTREWISVSGTARTTRDPATIKSLWASDWKMWLAEEGDPRHGTPQDPRIVLIGIDIHSAHFFEMDKPQPVVLYEMVKGWITGKEPDIGREHRI